MEDEVITKEEIAHNIKSVHYASCYFYVYILINLLLYFIFSAHLLYKLPIYMYIFWYFGLL